MAITTPVVTGSTTPDYAPYLKAINEIVYSKAQWQEGQKSNRPGLQQWAAQNAQQYYSQLPTDLANQLRNMDLPTAQQFLASVRQQASTPTRPAPATQTSSTTTTTAITNPYDRQVADLIGQLTERVNTSWTNPMDAQVAALIAQLQSRINAPPVDPRTTPEYEAAQAAVQRQVADNIRLAQEALGESGFARSTNLAERSQSIADAGTEYLETQLVPQIAQQIFQRDQQGLMNSMAMLDALMRQQGLFDERQRMEMQNLSNLLTALTGQQALVDSRQQWGAEHELALSRQDLQERMFQFEQQQASIENERARIQEALRRVEAFGTVTEQDAAILGVPAGTPSFAAREAATQRQHQLDMLERQIQADRANLQTRLSHESELARLNREASQREASINQLLSLWQATGYAPPGLESFGVTPGQEYNPYLTPSQRLDQIRLDQMMQELRDQERFAQAVPSFQRKYNMDPATAEALVAVLDNPSYEAAKADLKANESRLVQAGIDVKAVAQALEKELNPSQDELERQWKAIGSPSNIPKLDWMRWYRSPQGRIAGLSFEEWQRTYGPTIR